jgi:nitroreductase
MITNQVDHQAVRAALALATRAPSIHNSQPWRWQITGQTVHLYADLSRWLPATEADGRDLLLSCGAALHHLRVALAAAGVRSAVQRLRLGWPPVGPPLPVTPRRTYQEEER